MLQGGLEIVCASICAGFVQHAALHPLDTIKVRLQYEKPLRGDALEALFPQAPTAKRLGRFAGALAPPNANWNAPFLGDLAGAYRILRTSSPRALYRGLAPSLAAVVPTAIVYMPTYEAASALLTAASAVPAVAVAPLAGVMTGMACAAVRVPASVLKSRVQLGLAPDAWTAFKTALKSGGPRALYVGFSATVALDVAVAVVQFSALDFGRRHTGLNSAQLGFVASALATVATEPLDVVRTRIMAQLRREEGSKAKGRNFDYRGLRDGISKATAAEGVSALYRGLLPRLLLKSIGGAIWYSTYVGTKALFLDVNAPPR